MHNPKMTHVADRPLSDKGDLQFVNVIKKLIKTSFVDHPNLEAKDVLDRLQWTFNRFTVYSQYFDALGGNLTTHQLRQLFVGKRKEIDALFTTNENKSNKEKPSYIDKVLYKALTAIVKLQQLNFTSVASLQNLEKALRLDTDANGLSMLTCINTATELRLFKVVIGSEGNELIEVFAPEPENDILVSLDEFIATLNTYITNGGCTQTPTKEEKPVDKWNNPACGRNKSYADMTQQELVHGDHWSRSIATHLHNIAVYDMSKPDYKPTKEHRDMLIAGYDRVNYLNDLGECFERALETKGYTPNQIKEKLRSFEMGRSDWDGDRMGVTPETPSLVQLIRGFHPIHGLEPLPFIQARDKRFVNMDWVKWRTAVNLEPGNNEGSEKSVIDNAGRRTIEMLFPTKEAKLGIMCRVNPNESPTLSSYNPDDCLLPYEIKITRNFNQLV